METAKEFELASENRAEMHRHWADRAWGLAVMAREDTAQRHPDIARAHCAASRAFWAAGDALAAAADAFDTAGVCNSGDDPQPDEYEYATEAAHVAKAAFGQAITAWKYARDRNDFDQAKEIDAAESAEAAARLVREAEDIAERMLNGR